MELGATPLDKPLLHRSGAVEGRRWPTDLNGWLLLYDRLPPQGAGIALALVGYAGLLGLVAGAMPMLAPFLLPLRVGTLCISALIQKVLVLRLFVNCNFVELESLHLSSAHGALLVAIQLTLAQAPGLAPASVATAVATCATVAILFAAVLQLGVYAHFVHHIVVYRAKVEPFWTPVMLCFATLPLDRTGQLPYWLRLSGLLFGWGTTALMWPLCVRRMLRMPSKAADPSIFMLMAPVAFCTIGVFTNGDADALYVLLSGTMLLRSQVDEQRGRRVVATPGRVWPAFGVDAPVAFGVEALMGISDARPPPRLESATAEGRCKCAIVGRDHLLTALRLQVEDEEAYQQSVVRLKKGAQKHLHAHMDATWGVAAS